MGADKERVVILGASGHGKVVADILERSGVYAVAGFLVSDSAPGGQFFGLPLLGGDAELPRLMETQGVRGICIAVGDNWTRRAAWERIAALAPGIRFPAAVHPSASVARGAVIGEGAVIAAGAVLGPDCHVGRFAIVNTLAGLDHDSRLGDFASLAPGASAGGNVTVGDFASIGIGASIIHGRTVGEHAVVGAQALVLEDVPPCSVTYGVPARVQRLRTIGDRYL